MTGKIILNQVCKLVRYIVCFVLVFITTLVIPGNCVYAFPGKYHFGKGAPFRAGIVLDTFPFNFAIRDSNNIVRNEVNGKWRVNAGGFTFSFNDSIVLNYKKWNVAPGNQISFSPFGIIITGLMLTNDSARISISSRQLSANSPLDISIENFSMADLAGIVTRDSALISGVLDAKIAVSDLHKKLPSFTGTAFINGLALMKQVVGRLEVNAQKLDEQTVHTTFHLEGNGNEINAAGNYFLNSAIQQLNILLDIKKLHPSLLQGLFRNDIIFTAGNVTGLVALKGKLNQPEWTGNLNFDSVNILVPSSGTEYFIKNQKVILDYPAIHFNQFMLNDFQGHSLLLDGFICSNSLKQYDLNLILKAGDFAFLNAPKAINNQLYGFAGADATIHVNGNSTKPVLKADMRLNEKTDLTLVLPDKNTGKDDAGTVVRFVEKGAIGLPQNAGFKKETEPAAKKATGLLYSLNIAADNRASLNIILDPATGDELRVQGDAKLQAGLDSANNMLLKGTYSLDSGYYELNYQFSKKRFNVIRGSTISFNGNPIDALINIRAVHLATTSPAELLGNEVGSIDPLMIRSFNRAIPFQVILLLKGSLNQPTINFDIQIKEGTVISAPLRRTIENKLQQLRSDMAAINKQVFALLVMERFVGEQSTDFFKGNGSSTDFSDIAKSSVSQFLSAALDEIASDLFKGINVDLNLNSYKDFIANDDRRKNDLGVEVSKNFLNDRLSVTVGRTYGIESQDGSAKAAQQKGSRFLPDVTVNYKLSKDGKYMLRSYNKDQFEVILDGYVVETGLGFIVTMDYDKFHELFIKKRP